MFKNIEKEDLLKTNEGDAIKVKAQAENTWQMLTVQEKEQFNLIVTIRDRNVCFCNEKNGKFMVACDSCNCWYHNKCLGFEHGFTHAKLLFVCPKCQQNIFGLLLQFLRSNLQTFIPQNSWRPFLNLTNDQKILLNNLEFPAKWLETCLKENIVNPDFHLTQKSISKPCSNCYLNAALQVLEGSDVNAFLPVTNSTQSPNLLLPEKVADLRKRLCDESRSSFLQFDYCSRNSRYKEPLIGSILQ